MGSFVDLTGRIFGRLVVAGTFERRPYTKKGQNRTFWLCACSCGKQKQIASGQLLGNVARSCGCLRNEKSGARRRTHGKSGNPEYQVWKNMRRRCYSPTASGYANYGARGIAVCNRWLGKQGFANFLLDMGPIPSPKYTIDRIDNDGNYEPQNCRWATRLEQGRNKRRNRLVSHEGKTLAISEWSEITGVNRRTIAARLDKGWTASEALTLPVMRR